MEGFDRLQVDDTAAVSAETQFDAISNREPEKQQNKIGNTCIKDEWLWDRTEA